MSVQPLVSIIIPTFNRAHLLSETLDSVLAQTYSHWECIVVDDGSTDGTEALLKAYMAKDSRFQYHKRPDSHLPGGNGARNYGFEISKGDYIQWFDDDDVMLPEFLKQKLTAFKDTINFVVCSGTIVSVDMEILGSLQMDNSLSLYKGFVLWRNQITTNCVLFKRSFLIGKTLFNPEILRGQESEFFGRLFFDVYNDEFVVISEKLFLYRQHDTTKSSKNKVYNPVYKTSEITIAIENLKRSILLNDLELIHYFYRLLIHFLFRALEHRDEENVKIVVKAISNSVKPLNWWVVFQLQLVTNVLLFSKRSFYRIEMYFKTYTL
ncbi:glycosyltransferase family 2 protein [Bizionia sp. M204]|uniref:glycosyltransferase family 2 protein n=1 Tax=Bizionia sp. M204 TaxID=2675331 RepID=UPI002047841A|nr:glycosyltransferase family 2 protein [Bizionia sp. M204]UPS91678.1 glycosyltransferase [Bizionia sp. M204]